MAAFQVNKTGTVLRLCYMLDRLRYRKYLEPTMESMRMLANLPAEKRRYIVFLSGSLNSKYHAHL